ncbi:uncharacterized protein LOC117305897 isoform X1 [Asterias rubens]|uniref:uncharacterized protein LOC117305897 isoform X1 n=1 Tax=Asterias rubens TaxID=7604 RepID=UPI0014558552|nr:uncharacterized protein LOC117305897 isoform X1 [Asterias rubens]
MNDMANMYCRPDDNSCFTVEACNELYANFPKLPDIPIECDGTYGTCRTFGCSWWLLMLLLLIPISCCLACYLKWHVFPFIEELGGSSCDMESIELTDHPDSSQLDSAPAGSTQAGNSGECGDEAVHIRN